MKREATTSLILVSDVHNLINLMDLGLKQAQVQRPNFHMSWSSTKPNPHIGLVFHQAQLHTHALKRIISTLQSINKINT